LKEESIQRFFKKERRINPNALQELIERRINSKALQELIQMLFKRKRNDSNARQRGDKKKKNECRCSSKRVAT
jgi:hypothetical protein